MANFLLVHGAFYGGWCWQRVAERLRAKGHHVLTPTLTGCGERQHLLSRDVGLETHVRDLEQVLTYEDLRDVILVGHSYGGTVMTVAAARVPSRIKQLVFLDAQAPVNGQTASGALAEGTSDKLAQLSAGDDWLLPPLPLDAVEVLKPADIAWVESRRHPHPLRTLFEAVTIAPGALDAIPKGYIECLRHEHLIALFGVDPLRPFAERARREGWRFDQLDAGHDAMVTAPAAVADLLLSYA